MKFLIMLVHTLKSSNEGLHNNKGSFATPYFDNLPEDGFQFSLKRFQFQYKMEFFHHFGNHKTLTLVKIKQKHLVLICRQKMKIP